MLNSVTIIVNHFITACQ